MKRKAVVLLLGQKEDVAFRTLLGRPAALYVLEAVCGLDPEAVLVVSSGGSPSAAGGWERLVSGLAAKAPVFLLAAKANQGGSPRDIWPSLSRARATLAKYPDRDILAVPSGLALLRTRTLRAFLAAHRSKGCALTFLSRGGGGGLSGVFAFRSAEVFPRLAATPKRGRAGFETLAARLTKAGKKVGFWDCPNPDDVSSAEGPDGFARASGLMRDRKNRDLARRGVVFLDPATAWVDWPVKIGPRTVIYPSVVIEGETRIGPDGRVYPHVHIMSSSLGRGVKVLSSTVIAESVLEDGTQVGPFSRLRPKTRVCSGAKVGNFVEMKNTVFGPRSKAQHLSYLGDSRVGEEVNVGAGTITCNYDGVSKKTTVIDSGAFIGSGTELVAPVNIGRGAYVAAGSTITRDVPPDSLAIARARQVEKPGWILTRMRERKRRPRG